MKNLQGTGVALVTPFVEDGNIDYPALQKLVDHVINGGVNYLVVCGTTAETPTLSSNERNSIIKFIIDINNGRLPIVVGIGGNNTSQVIKDLKSLDIDGISAILSSSPAYNKPTQEGIYQHYKALSETAKLPIILYNVPGRTA